MLFIHWGLINLYRIRNLFNTNLAGIVPKQVKHDIIMNNTMHTPT